MSERRLRQKYEERVAKRKRYLDATMRCAKDYGVECKDDKRSAKEGKHP